MIAFLAGCSSLKTGYTLAILDHEWRDANRLFDEGHYQVAAAAYENLLTRTPESSRREQMVYRQGMAYLEVRNYHDAYEIFEAYLDRYPSGKSREEVNHSIIRIMAEQADNKRATEERLIAAEQDQEHLLALEKEFPSDPRIKFALGNIYYELEEFDKAGEAYYAAQALEAAYQEKELIQRRLVLNEKGEPTARTPSQLNALDIERNPIAVMDVHGYRERGNRDYSNTARELYRVVTGKVMNRGSKTVYGVTVEIRFQNALKNILDFQEVHFDRMRPGEVRPFLVRAEHYDSLYNITDIDIIKRFERAER